MDTDPRAFVIRLHQQRIIQILGQLFVQRGQQLAAGNLDALDGQQLFGEPLVEIGQQQRTASAGERQAE